MSEAHRRNHTVRPARGTVGQMPALNGQAPHQPGVTLPGPSDLVGLGLPVNSPVEELRRKMRLALSQRLSERIRSDDQEGVTGVTVGQRREQAESILAEVAEDHARAQLAQGGEVIDAETERQILTAVLDEVFGLAGLEPLLRNPDIENININGAGRVFVRYADGRREQRPPVVDSDEELIQLIRDLATRSGVEERRFDRGSPGVNFQLPGGERVFAVMAVTPRPSVAIRRHRFQKATLADLRKAGTIDRGLEAFLTAVVRARKNVLITGGTAIGKTTMLRALASAIPAHERLITIEDTLELFLDADAQAHPDVVTLQAREANIEGQGAVSQAELVRWALRMSPDRVIVGEVRGSEVIPMCNSMSQGNDGSMGTLHASASRGAFTKLAAYAVQGPERLSLEETNLLVASALDFVVHLDVPRTNGTGGGRTVSSIREVIDADEKQVVSNEVFRPGQDLRAVPGAPLRSETAEDLAQAGFDADWMARPEWWWRR